MKIYLIRHGETTSDIEERYGGEYDDHLTKKGIKQARELAKKLIDKNIKFIFCSSKIRTKETLEIVNKKLELNYKIVKDLRERNSNGILTGMKIEEAKVKYPDLVELRKDYKNTLPQGESYLDFKKRILNSFNDILDSDYKSIAIITHGGPIYCIFREIIKKEIKNIGDCEIIELEKDQDDIKIINLGNAYLEE